MSRCKKDEPAQENWATDYPMAEKIGAAGEVCPLLVPQRRLSPGPGPPVPRGRLQPSRLGPRGVVLQGARPVHVRPVGRSSGGRFRVGVPLLIDVALHFRGIVVPERGPGGALAAGGNGRHQQQPGAPSPAGTLRPHRRQGRGSVFHSAPGWVGDSLSGPQAPQTGTAF